jgi:hypothetical protein
MRILILLLACTLIGCGEECQDESCSDTTTLEHHDTCLVNYDKLGQVPCETDTTTIDSGK